MKFSATYLACTAFAFLAACGGAGAASTISIVAVAPKTLYIGADSAISVTAVYTADHNPAVTDVSVSLLVDDAASIPLCSGTTGHNGRLNASFTTPDVEPGSYTLRIETAGAEPVTASVQLARMPVVLIETDKPIYKPSQTIHGRVLTLTNQLAPVASDASVEISDGKGVKIYKTDIATNAFGVGTFDLDLASELNYGTWKIKASSGSAQTVADVRVEEYVLPRFDVEVITPRDYFLVDEPVTGNVEAAYFFGKPVDGTLEVKASRYIGVWEQYAVFTTELAGGRADFALPAVGYVSGTTGAGGAGSARLEITVTDTSGHGESKTKLLKITESAVQHQLISLSRSVAPGRPFDVLLAAETPDGEPVSCSAQLVCEYFDIYWMKISEERRTLTGMDGTATVTLQAPENTSAAWIRSSVDSAQGTAQAELTVPADYSPTASFLHLSQLSDSPVQVGQYMIFEIFKTSNTTVYYDLFANGRTLYSAVVPTGSSFLIIKATPQMLPKAKLVAYTINPNSEVSADSIDFEVVMEQTTGLEVTFDAAETAPADPVTVTVNAGTESMVGISIVDESVYALNEGRLNMQAVFDELERRFMEPQAETHDDSTCGAYEVFDEAGLQVVTSANIQVPQGRNIWDDMWLREAALDGANMPVPPKSDGGDNGLAEVTHVRQFFPETWLWMPDILTDPDGRAAIELTSPDSITTWRLHAVSTSNEGLGICESALTVFQEFFAEPDLPYAVTRGEQFPVRIQIFNYLDQPQTVHVEITDAEWFELLDEPSCRVDVDANSVAAASFTIQPELLGTYIIEVTARSALRADAVRRQLIVEPEGTRREIVENGIIKAGDSLVLDTSIPAYSVAGSEKILLSVTPSLVAQSINGVDDLLGMPYGCGEQNMIFFAPDVEVLRYLDATGQLTPEVRAEAEHFITTGYQRQLTFRHADGSFSAFGESDESGSLWLTAFVLGSFSAARDIYSVDENVLAEAAAWIGSHQKADGSWEPVGFICHSEMIGGMEGNYALTAFVAVALSDYDQAPQQVLAAALDYLSANVSGVWDDAYALAITALAFAANDHASADAVLDRLLELAVSDADGIHWQPHAIETTAYAALAMIEKQMPQANDAVKWLSLQRNGLGGFSNTQDTVMALRALMRAARAQSRNVDLAITASAVNADGTDGEILAQFTVDSGNFDVLQIAELAAADSISLTATGSGESRFQLVRRFNVLLADDVIQNNMAIEVTYDANTVEVDDIVNVTATVRYFGPKDSTGMMIVDVGVPTGFAVVSESLDALVAAGLVSRVEVAGRKVILYVDNLYGGEVRTFTFQVKAMFPVRAIIPDSTAYLYYDPDVCAEDAGRGITISAPLDGDLNGDGCVNLDDFADLARGWPATYEWLDLGKMAANWLGCR